MTLPWPDSPYGYSTNTTIAQCNMTVATQAGFTGVRRIMAWSNLEPTEGNFSASTLAQLDAEIALAETNHLNFTFVLDQAPSWANSAYHNGCSNIDSLKALALVQFLLNHYNGGGLGRIARIETGNEGYDDVGFGNPCQSFENAVPVLQQVYPWVKANYPDVLIGTPAHFNRQAADYLSVQSSLYNGFYGSAKGLFDYSNIHWYGDVRSNGLYTGPDGPQQNGAETFNAAWQDAHAVDVSFGNGSIPLYVTETGISVPGTSGQNSETDHASYFVGGQGCTGVLQDCAQSGGVVTHLYLWTIQNSDGYSLTKGCNSGITYFQSFYAVKSFIASYPAWPANLTGAKYGMFAV